MFKVKHKKFELLTFVMILFVCIITLFGCINIYNSCKIINNQANADFIHYTEFIKQRENNYFYNAEREAERCKTIIEVTIDKKKLEKIAPFVSKYDKTNIPYIRTYLNSTIAPILYYSSKHIEGLVSIYFDFDHNLLKHKDLIGVWYADPNLDEKFELTDSGPTSSMYPPNDKDLAWFYVPRNLKKGIWSLPYIDADIKKSMITYSSPVYKDKKFLGVVGVDISMDKIKNELYKLKIYHTGKAYLIDRNNQIIFSKGKVQSSTESIDLNLYTYLEKHRTEKGIILKNNNVELVKSFFGEKLFTITKLYNNFILVLEVPVDELYAETIKLASFTSLLLVLAVLLVTLITIETNSNIKKINNELMHKEKLISIGTVTAEIAHEINNPIGFVNCNLDTLRKFIEKIKTLVSAYETGLIKVLKKESTAEAELENINNLKTDLKTDFVIESLDEIIDESKDGIKRVSDIIVNLKSFAKDDRQDSKTEEKLENIVAQSLTLLSNKIKSNIQIVKNFSETPPLRCNKNQIEQVLINLIDNACYSVEKKGAQDKKITISTYKKGKNAFLEIEDNGIGIDKSKLNKIFDTFFTTKARGEGTGLGLSIVYEIITKKHKGEISVESKKGKGTKFIIKIPYS